MFTVIHLIQGNCQTGIWCSAMCLLCVLHMTDIWKWQRKGGGAEMNRAFCLSSGSLMHAGVKLTSSWSGSPDSISLCFYRSTPDGTALWRSVPLCPEKQTHIKNISISSSLSPSNISKCPWLKSNRRGSGKLAATCLYSRPHICTIILLYT